MEEIIGFKIWIERNTEMLEKKYPFVLKNIEIYITV